MKIQWNIDENDLDKVKSFYAQHAKNTFVLHRIENNVQNPPKDIDKATFFQTMVNCLISTQQRSGPDTPATRFISRKPYPIRYSDCLAESDVEQFVATQIRNAGLRRHLTIGKEVSHNFERLEAGLWQSMLKVIGEIDDDPEAEQTAARFIKANLKGFGPKQSRNLIQGLKVSKYEIPIDSRITKWLNNFGFPVELSASALQDENYYQFVSDGFQALCRACEIYPCALDAAIFASFDTAEWDEESVIW